MYLDIKGIKTIGVGFNLENSNAKNEIRKIGANYDKIVNGIATYISSKCQCDQVYCLTNSQIQSIFSYTLESSIACANQIGNYCCNVQDVIVDMVFNLGCAGLNTFTMFLGLLQNHQWKAAANDLHNTKWCRQVKNRCIDDANNIAKGC